MTFILILLSFQFLQLTLLPFFYGLLLYISLAVAFEFSFHHSFYIFTQPTIWQFVFVEHGFLRALSVLFAVKILIAGHSKDSFRNLKYILDARSMFIRHPVTLFDDQYNFFSFHTKWNRIYTIFTVSKWKFKSWNLNRISFDDIKIQNECGEAWKGGGKEKTRNEIGIDYRHYNVAPWLGM